MFQGNWTCSKCGGDIKELPFEPHSNSGLTCRDCYFKEKDGGSGGSGAPTGDGGAAASDVDTGAGADLDDRDVPDFDPGAVAGEPAPETPEMAEAPTAERKMFEGDWKCATCGGPINSLPFQPRDVTNLKCIDCFKKSRG